MEHLTRRAGRPGIASGQHVDLTGFVLAEAEHETIDPIIWFGGDPGFLELPRTVRILVGDEKTLITLHLTVTSPPGGDLSLIEPREFEVCDDDSKTCVPDLINPTWNGGVLIAN